MTSERRLDALVARVSVCRVCIEHPRGKPLPHEPRPVLRATRSARLLVAGQAPGIRVHNSGLPFNDPSGERLREWMGVDRQTFYDATRINIVPMGFCFPGWTAAKGDLPPRRECRATWHDELFGLLPQIETILAIGSHAQDYHLRRLGLANGARAGMSDIVRAWRDYAEARPRLFPLPHPSWRNSGWLKKNPWFDVEVLPALREAVQEAIAPRPIRAPRCAASLDT